MMMGGGEETPAAAGAGAGAGADTPVVPTLPSGQYVKLIASAAQDPSAMRDDGTTAGNVDDTNEILNLAELEVFAKDGTTSLTDDVRGVEAANFHPAGPLGNLIDGNFTNFAHTLGRTADDFDAITVDLGSVKEIGKIKITNRVDCCKNRAIGIKAVILGADGTTVIKETPAITTKADTYTFTFPGTTWA
tara:strand:+ start:61 stop:630 length:570 start_codon:yes stop_codon:yes gene_type:complete